MDARVKTVREILHSGDQFLVPFFQRYYSWKQKHWERLWNDVVALLHEEITRQHFLGPLVCTPAGNVPGEVHRYQLIDGQQRLTTITILLAALRDLSREFGQGAEAEVIEEDYILHRRAKGNSRYKVLPRTGDREVLAAVVANAAEKQHRDSSIVKAHRYFSKAIRSLIESRHDTATVLESLRIAIADRLSLVVITITGENPYEIFESLNSTGLPLSHADLIRNFLFMQVPLEEQDAFNDEHWQVFESDFGSMEEVVGLSQTAFFRNYLLSHGRYVSKRDTFLQFKLLYQRSGRSASGAVSLLLRYLDWQWRISDPGREEHDDLRVALDDLRLLDMGAAHPLLLELFRRMASGEISAETLVACIHDLTSFILRRSVCGASTRQYNQWFTQVIGDLGADARGDLREYLLSRGWPDDDLFVQSLGTVPIYRGGRNLAKLILRTIERASAHKESPDLDALQIEHVLPQVLGRNEHGERWRRMLGETWEAEHRQLVHTIGNLTLTGYNPDLGNRSFDEKQSLYASSNVGLNEHFVDLPGWNGERIRARSRWLGQQAAGIWPRPKGGPAFVPGGVAEAKRGRRLPAREVYTLFREEFIERLATDAPGRAVRKAGASGMIRIPSGFRGAEFLVRVRPQRNRVSASIRLRGSQREAVFRQMTERRASLEREFGEPLIWKPSPDSSTSAIGVAAKEFDLHSAGGRADAVNWAVQAIVRLIRIFNPYLQEALPPRPPGSRRRAGDHQEFWNGFVDYLSSRGREAQEDPKPRHLLILSRPVKGTHIGCIRGVRSGALTAEVVFYGGKRFERYRRAIEQKELFNASIAEPVSWMDGVGKTACKIQVSADLDLHDRDDWPNHYEWLYDRSARLTQALEQVFDDE